MFTRDCQRSHEVVVALSGDEAIEKVVNSEKSFDLVLTDMNMPGMGGSELIEYLDQFQKDVRVIAMSGAGPDRSSIKDVETQIAACLPKPFRSRDVLSALEYALAKTS